MPFDPTLPQENTLADAAQMRGQFNGLKDLIDAGLLTGVVIDAVNTVAPGSPAAVSANISNGVLHLAFDIPQGNDGPQGPQGQQGNDGQPGEVTGAVFNAAIAATSSNSNSVPTLDPPFTNDPPVPGDLETLRAKLNELIVALRRP